RMGNYAARTQHIELFIDGQYQGVYVLMEKVKRDNDRIDIAKLTAGDTAGLDVTGGYIIKSDRYGGNGNGSFGTNFTNWSYNVTLLYEYPGDTVIHPLQAAYLSSYIDSFGNALYSPQFADPLVGYRNYADVNSFIDFMLINELAKNPDSYGYSTFLVKPKNDEGRKLQAGPPWDLDIAWKNTSFLNADLPSGFMYSSFTTPLNWWFFMMQDVAFQSEVACRWQELRQNQLSVPRIHQYIDSMAVYLNESQQRNFALWPVLGQDVFLNVLPCPPTFQAEIDTLKSWVTRRIGWLDTQFNTGCLTGTNLFAAAPETFTLFPVPAGDEVMIRFSTPETGVLEICDASGRMLLVQNIENTTQQLISVAGFASGYYVLRFKSTSGTATSRPLLKAE
ncbi:MAG: CotH kinase family protein, partial [Bacteroidia bacterium]